MIQYLKCLEKYGKNEIVRILDHGNAACKSYEDYLKDLRSCAYMLEERLGDIKDKHIGIIAESGYEYVVLLFAIIFSRAVAVPLNEKETADNISNAVKTAHLDAIIASEALLNFEINNANIVDKKVIFEYADKEKELSDFDESEEERPALMIFTSGTTSLAKGAAFCVRSLFHQSRNGLPEVYSYDQKENKGSVIYSNFPFYHIGGIISWIDFTENCCTICYSKDPKKVLLDLRNEKIDFATVTPAILKLWANCIKSGRIDRLGGVKHIMTAGAALDVELINPFFSNGITIGQYYGQTETCGTIAYNYDLRQHPDSVGKPPEDVEVSIVDGEICVRYWGNMVGYYNNPEETDSCLKDGWIYTGDLGHIDEEGYLILSGRKKNLIILSGGENVSPEEIEKLLYENPRIRECLVYENNDRIAADIYSPELSHDEVRAYIDNLNKNVPIYKRIYSFNLRENEFEKTSIGKIKRY